MTKDTAYARFVFHATHSGGGISLKRFYSVPEDRILRYNFDVGLGYVETYEATGESLIGTWEAPVENLCP